jgi:hypothetical protein
VIQQGQVCAARVRRRLSGGCAQDRRRLYVVLTDESGYAARDLTASANRRLRARLEVAHQLACGDARVPPRLVARDQGS